MPNVHTLSARNFRAGNGCTNFMGALDVWAISACRFRSFVLLFFKGGGEKCQFCFLGARGFSASVILGLAIFMCWRGLLRAFLCTRKEYQYFRDPVHSNARRSKCRFSEEPLGTPCGQWMSFSFVQSGYPKNTLRNDKLR